MRAIFGPKHFSSIWGFCNAVKPMVSGLAATCIALAYDFLGSYTGPLLYGLTMSLCALATFVIATRYVGKIDFEGRSD